MPTGARSSAERSLYVSIRDQYWDQLFEKAREARMRPNAWASAVLERHLARTQKRQKPSSQAA